MTRLFLGGKEQAVYQQRIPAKYICLEEALDNYRCEQKSSVLTEQEYQ
jgi:hypothetical protein